MTGVQRSEVTVTVAETYRHHSAAAAKTLPNTPVSICETSLVGDSKMKIKAVKKLRTLPQTKGQVGFPGTGVQFPRGMQTGGWEL